MRSLTQFLHQIKASYFQASLKNGLARTKMEGALMNKQASLDLDEPDTTQAEPAADTQAHSTGRNSAKEPATRTKPINLALQGGGSHGAFTWGVLDALLEDGRIDFSSISGTSAGAMNAIVMAHGLTEGRMTGRNAPQLARDKLEDFWRQVSVAAGNHTFENPLRHHPMLNGNLFNHPLTDWAKPKNNHLEMLTRLVSPYQFNPLNINPLKTVLERSVDFDLLRTQCAIELHICATHIQTGRARIFTNAELSVDVAMASACLPFIFQAVEIDGEHYWDGGYTGNPPLFPLFKNQQSLDIVLVQISPLARQHVPGTAAEIIDRANEISFNMPLLAELRAIDFVRRQLEQKQLPASQYRSIRMHVIEADDVMANYTADSKLKTDWAFLCELRDLGRARTHAWLADNLELIGKKSSVDIAKRYLQ